MKRSLLFKQVKFIPYGQLKNVFVPENVQFKANGGVTITKYVGDYANQAVKDVDIYFTPLNKRGGAWHPFAIHRYMPFSRFKQDVENNTLTFISPLKWRDPFENVFYNPTQMIQGYTLDIRCICTTYDHVENEESAWARSTDVDDKLIRVTYRFDELCTVLEKAAQEEDCQFYFSVVDYSQSKDNLVAGNAPSYQTIDDYLNVLSLKRKAFSYENELRIFAVYKKNVDMGIKPIGLCPDAYSKILDSVTMPPMEPFLREDLRFNIYDKLQDLENLQLRKSLLTLNPGVRICQSRLYSQNNVNTSWIKNIVNNKRITLK